MLLKHLAQYQNRTDANVAYLTAGSKKTPMCKRTVKSFCVKFFRFVGNLYPHISANFYTFILIFHQMALIIPNEPIVFTRSSFEYWMQTLREQGLDEKAIISSDTLTKGESWALLRKSAVESTTLAQPFCVNLAVGLGDLPRRLRA